ncbi:MAG: creatininase family protein [Synergistaceae bacterium]|nr:creatininase family protein [Synergistaceae bacterium]
MWLQENSWEELKILRDRAKGVAIVPIGSTEQHGCHLPLGTDTMVAVMLAEDGASATETVAVPPIWYGWSPHHMVLPGTITIRPEVLIELFYDVMESLSRHGFDKIVAINGHRIVNVSWMQIAAERAQRILGIKVVIFDPAYMSKEFAETAGFGPVGHSEEIETSHMLYRMPQLVHMERARDNPVEPHPLYSVDPCFRGDTLCYVPSTAKDMERSALLAGGTTGTPSKSDADAGRRYHEHLVRNLTQVIRGLQAGGKR